MWPSSGQCYHEVKLSGTFGGTFLFWQCWWGNLSPHFHCLKPSGHTQGQSALGWSCPGWQNEEERTWIIDDIGSRLDHTTLKPALHLDFQFLWENTFPYYLSHFKLGFLFIAVQSKLIGTEGERQVPCRGSWNSSWLGTYLVPVSDSYSWIFVRFFCKIFVRFLSLDFCKIFCNIFVIFLFLDFCMIFDSYSPSAVSWAGLAVSCN